MRLAAEDREYAVIGAIPVDAPGITYIYGRQSCDTRAMEGDIDLNSDVQGMAFKTRSHINARRLGPCSG